MDLDYNCLEVLKIGYRIILQYHQHIKDIVIMVAYMSSSVLLLVMIA